MQDPVQDGRGDHGIAEDLVPLREASVRGQGQGPFFVPPRDELEEQMRPMSVDRDIADLVDDQELGLRVELQPLIASLTKAYSENRIEEWLKFYFGKKSYNNPLSLYRCAVELSICRLD